MKEVLWFINCVINLIYPNVCGICDKICKNDLCKKCEIELNNILKLRINKYKNKNFKEHIYLFKYEEIIKDRLIKYKFNGKSYIYKAFVNILIKNKKICRFLKTYDIIIPVPIHYNRKVTRGYNQSALFAKKISENLDIKYKTNILYKRINNKPQSTKNKSDRITNVIGVYCVKNKNEILNKKVLLVDDIYTTGSTVNECSRVLKENGAKTISVLTIAKD